MTKISKLSQITCNFRTNVYQTCLPEKKVAHRHPF